MAYPRAEVVYGKKLWVGEGADGNGIISLGWSIGKSLKNNLIYLDDRILNKLIAAKPKICCYFAAA